MKLQHTVIPASGNLDPITVITEDHEPGKGRIYVHVFGCCWTAWWGAMSGRCVLDFVSRCDAGYIANNLISGRRQWISSRKAEEREEGYLLRICEALREHLNSTTAEIA